ncbi:helix-turn-helix transcriptional regulator [Cohnella sp. AR92]|uniref:helix-turn-helix domain-containing protein n=1 Tax=Cohnella sp. AR92 TaxID=648716 RepID=UPI000F8D8E9D|nr:helix-turn-helix transcriptional regulator [Cohnella sp. AR92]RUS42089.1 XRE family transcriptional regulator [Cohnella sp. AR92]
MNISRGRCLLGDLIKARGWTQTYYAERSGRSQRMISHFCSGDRIMQPEDIYIAEEILECDFRDLYEGFKTKPSERRK